MVDYEKYAYNLSKRLANDCEDFHLTNFLKEIVFMMVSFWDLMQDSTSSKNVSVSLKVNDSKSFYSS